MSRSDVRIRRAKLTTVAAAIVAATSSQGAGAASTASAPPACDVVLVSPTYAHDRTLLCVHPDSQGVRVIAITTTAGRTWHDTAMAGLERSGPLDTSLTLTVSPRFANDHAIFATVSSGTYISTNLAATFSPVDTLSTDGGTDNPVAFAGSLTPLPATPSTQQHVLLAYADAPLAAVIDPADGTRRAVLGVPGRGALRFVVPPSARAPDGALVIVNDPDVPTGDHAAIYRCDATLTCVEALFAFPAGIRFGTDNHLVLAPDGSLLATLVDRHGAPQLWRSTNGGASFTVMRSVMKIIDGLPPTSASPFISVTASAAHPHRLYLRVEAPMPRTGWKPGMAPASQVFRSEDSGATWRLVAYGRSAFQPGTRGTLPWRLGPANGRQIQLAPDGRLFADGSSETLATTWCSIDGGVHWTAGCRS